MTKMQREQEYAPSYEFDTAIRYPLAWNTYDTAWRFMFDFFSVGQALDCRPGDKVLDFAGGTCFVSEMLNRLGIYTVALDLGEDKLRVGQARFVCDTRLNPQIASFCCADGQKIPFADESFDGLICMNALHHMPDYYLSMAEIHRILKPGCRAVFSEPGSEHSQSPESLRVMREFGETEKDVLLSEIYTLARQVGFAHVYLLPFFAPQMLLLDLQTEPSPIGQSTVLPRSVSGAMQRLKSPIQRFLNIFKGQLQPIVTSTQETVSHLTPEQAILQFFQNVDNQRRWADSIVKGHPIFALEKPGGRQLTSRRPGLLRARIDLLSKLPDWIDVEAPFDIRVRVTNMGDTLWLAAHHEYGGQVTLGLKLSYINGRLLDDDLNRANLPYDIAPGDAFEFTHTITVPYVAPGNYVLTLDMVDEQVCWFEDRGSEVVSLPIEVR